MGKELHATPTVTELLEKQIDLGTDKAGYYKPDKYDIYFTMEKPYWQESWYPKAGKYHRMQTGNS